MKNLIAPILLAILAALPAFSQEAGSEAKPQIQVNFLNSCRPAEAEAEQMRQLLQLLRKRPAFSSDFEISRGVTTMSEADSHAAAAAIQRAAGEQDAPPASPATAGPGRVSSRWVRMQREFGEKAALINVQYSLTLEKGQAGEVLALHLRDTSLAMQLLISNSVTGGAAEVLGHDTPPERIRMERFGKPSIMLARCPQSDQTAYEPLFSAAFEILREYRRAMNIAAIVPSELSRLDSVKKSDPANKH